MMHASRHHYPEANVLLREGIEKREILLKERLDHVAQVRQRLSGCAGTRTHTTSVGSVRVRVQAFTERALRSGDPFSSEPRLKACGAQVIKREDTKKLIQERRKDLQNPRSREDLLGSLKGQVLDLLMQYLSKLEVPPIVGTKEVCSVAHPAARCPELTWRMMVMCGPRTTGWGWGVRVRYREHRAQWRQDP
eukprot:3285926-Rhodomonas_salina.5